MKNKDLEIYFAKYSLLIQLVLLICLLNLLSINQDRRPGHCQCLSQYKPGMLNKSLFLFT